MQEIKLLTDLLEHYRECFHDKEDVFAYKIKNRWIKYSSRAYIYYANRISFGLLALGVKKGDRIATIINNRPEWNFIDMGLLQIGAINVPIYPTISKANYQHILKDAEVNYVFISDKDAYHRIKELIHEIPSIKGVYSISEVAELKHWNEVIELGKANINYSLLSDTKKTIHPHDVATIIYTSGTTSLPKGVMLTHQNIVSNCIAAAKIPHFDENSRAVSYLPLCHVYERTLNYVYQYLGVSVFYIERTDSLMEDIKEIRPNVMSAVPRVLEKIYDRIIMRGRSLKGLNRWIYFWAIELGLQYEVKNKLWYEIKRSIADFFIYRKWRKAFGGKLQLIISGGASLQARLARIFTAAKLTVLEGYGLTEASPIIAANTLERNGMCFGTVGPVLDGIQIKIAEDGEILCKGKNVMLGYYKQPDLTKEAIDEQGWLHTGDIGEILDNKFLKITDRKKEIFKTSGGKYIAPQVLENKFKESPFIEHIMIVGENQKFAAALIVPDFDYLKSWSVVKEITYKTNYIAAQSSRVIKRIQREVDQYNGMFGKTEQIKRFILLDKQWSVESGELSPTLKLRRKYIYGKYKHLIEEMYKEN